MKKFTIFGLVMGVILLFNMTFAYSQEDNVSEIDLDVISGQNNMSPETNESDCYNVSSDKVLCEDNFRNFDSRLNNFYLRLLRSKKEYNNNLEVGKTTRNLLEEQELLDNNTKERLDLILTNLENESVDYDEFVSQVKEILDNDKEYNYTLLNERWENFKNEAKNLSNTFKERVSAYNLTDEIKKEIRLRAKNSEIVSKIEEEVKENIKNYNFGKSVALMNQFKNSNMNFDDVKERVGSYLNGNVSLGRLKQEMSSKIKGASEEVRRNIYVNTKQKQIRENIGMMSNSKNVNKGNPENIINENFSENQPNVDENKVNTGNSNARGRR